MPSYHCSNCEYKSRFLHLLVRHYKDHDNMPGNRLHCPIKNCVRTYKSVSSLQNHISRSHKSSLLLSKNNTPQCSEVRELPPGPHWASPNFDESEADTFDNAGLCSHQSHVNQDEIGNHNSLTPSDEQLKLFLLNLKAKKYVSDNVCEMIVKYFESSYQNSINKVSEVLANLQNLSELEKHSILRPLNTAICDLNLYNTVHKQTIKLKEKNYIEPLEIPLQSNKKTVYIPLLESLELLLSHEDILAHVLQNNNATLGDQNVIDNFSTGDKAKNSILFNEHNSLQIQLYFDDYTLTNPLASSSRKHKICGVYFQLGNIPHFLRSKLYTIQLVSLTNTEVVKELGFEIVFQRLLEDLKKLETEGITVKFEDQVHHFRGSVSTLVADNLAAHEVGGFTTSFSGYRICRFCNACKDNFKTQFNEKYFTFRSVGSYKAQLELVDQNSDLSSIYGIKKNSFLNDLDYFHICWSSPSDISHDLFEGVCLDLLSTVLSYFIKQKYFDLGFLNETIMSFPYFGKDKTNKPAKLFANGSKISIRQTASQCLCLVKLLPLMIGHKIPTDCSYWKCYLSFLDCLDYIVAPSLSLGQIEFMRDLITLFVQSYSKLNNDIKIKPKLHYMIHFPTQYRYFGPLIHQSTLRYEGKHSNLKSLFGSSKNYKNPCLSIARRHQYLQSLHHHNSNFLEDENIQTRKFGSNDSPVNLLPSKIKSLFANIDPEQNISLMTKVVYNGLSYEEDGIIVLAFDYQSSYSFGKIHYVVLLKGILHLVVESLDTSNYCQHIHSYQLKEKNDPSFQLIQIGSLLIPNILSPYYHQDGIVVNLPYFIRC